MPTEIVIAVVSILIQIIGGAMPQRSRVPFISSLICITLTIILLVLYGHGRISQNLLLIVAIILTVVAISISLIYRKKEKPVIYDHNAYVSKMITDSKAKELLALPDALRALADLDGELALEVVNTKRSRGQLVGKMRTVLDRLQEESGIKRLDKGLPDQAIVDSVNDAIAELNVSGTKVNPETLTFMHHVVGVLDEEGVGISARRVGSDEYKKVARLKASIATQILSYTVAVYMTYSVGITSVLMMVEACPPELMARVLKLFRQTRTELRRERRDTLDFLLAGVNGLKEKELRG